MFDKTIINPTRTVHVPYEKTVTINKSSTAEDARLLHDLEKEAEKKVLSVAYSQLGNTHLDHAVVHKDRNLIDRNLVYLVLFQINGVKFREEIAIPYDAGDTLDAAVKVAIAKRLITELVSRVVGQL